MKNSIRTAHYFFFCSLDAHTLVIWSDCTEPNWHTGRYIFIQMYCIEHYLAPFPPVFQSLPVQPEAGL